MTIRGVGALACWLAIVASFVLSFSTWLALGVLSGFGWLALALPFCVDGYVTTALATWLTPGVSERLAKFARGNLYAVGLLGVFAQAGYHGASVHALGNPDWKTLLATVVGAFPMAIATLAIHIRARTVRELASSELVSELRGEAARASATPPASAIVPSQAPAVAPSTPLVVQPAQQSQSVTVAPAPMRPAQPVVPAAAPKPPRQAPPRSKVEQSGSGPRRSVTVDDARPLVRAGLGRNAVAQQLGIGTGAARRLIAEVHAEGGRLVAVP
jgi:hypothetical protein